MRTLAAGELPAFPADTAGIRSGNWTVASDALVRATPARFLAGFEGSKDAAAWAQTGGVEPGSVRLNVVVDTVFACFEAEEILHELRAFDAGLVASPLSYLSSFIRLFAQAPECIMPDRRDITAGTPCVDAYLRHLEQICKRRAARFESAVRPAHRLFADPGPVEPADLLQVPRGRITRSGIARNIETVLGFLLNGGSSDERTEAEFARAQLWQWVRHDTGVLDSGRIINATLFGELLHDARGRLAEDHADEALDYAAGLLLELTTSDDLAGALPDEGYPARS